MAGERKGITYEAVLWVVLQRLKKKGGIKGETFWNERPEGMTIEPDLVIGPDIHHPTHIFLVTHSGSAKESEKKLWRNLGELVEEKTLLATVPLVYNVAFDSVIKEDLKKIQAAAFDGQLIVGDKPYGRDLQRWVDENHGRLPADRFKKAGEIKALAAKKGQAITALLTKLEKDTGSLLLSQNTAINPLWDAQRKRKPGRVPVARETFLRRGVGKILLLDTPDQISKVGVFAAGAPKEIAEALLAIGLATKSIAGIRVSDPQMLWARENLTLEELKSLFEIREVPRVQGWLESLRGLAAVSHQLEFIRTHWADLIQAKPLFKALKTCHLDPSAIAPDVITSKSRRVWLFHILVEWIKICGKTRTSYGLAKLVRDVDQLANDAGHQKRVQDVLGRKPIWQAKRSVELGVTDWHSSASKQQFAFSDDDLARVCDALATRLEKLPAPEEQTDVAMVVEAVVQTDLEAKLLTYRNFKPFEVLINRALASAGLEGRIEAAVRACFADAAADAGAQLDPRSSGTTVMRVKNTLINWQSAHGSHTNDKKKELCGRAVGLRYSWDRKSKKFVPRPGVKKLILVVDGTWRQSDLDALAQAGWDEIFYPDEMDQLVRAIV